MCCKNTNNYKPYAIMFQDIDTFVFYKLLEETEVETHCIASTNWQIVFVINCEMLFVFYTARFPN